MIAVNPLPILAHDSGLRTRGDRPESNCSSDKFSTAAECDGRDDAMYVRLVIRLNEIVCSSLQDERLLNLAYEFSQRR